MDRNVFVAILLCAGIYFAWFNLNSKYNPPAPQQQSAAVQTTQNTAEQGSSNFSNQSLQSAAPKPSAAKETPARLVTLGDAQSYSVVISTQGGTIQRADVAEFQGKKLSGLDLLIGGSAQLELAIPNPDWAYLSNVTYRVLSSDARNLVLSYDDQNISVQRTYRLLPDLFAVDHDIQVNFKKQNPGFLFVGLNAKREIPKQENERRNVTFKKTGKLETWEVSSVSEVKEDLGEGEWIGFSSRYFLKALLDRGSNSHPQFQTRPLQNGEVSASLIYKAGTNTLNLPLRFYYGPKEIGLLKTVGQKLEAAVDFGWFTLVAYPLLYTLKWFHKYIHNYGIAIILLTILVKLLTYPLTFKSMKGMKEMQRIQPQLQKLRERYKDDKEKLNSEMMQLMKSNGYNPMSGCLPILIQMPVFIALYNVLYGTIDLYGEPFFGWIHDLSMKDPYYVTPVLLAGMMFLQQKLTPNTTTDPTQQRMMMIMPLVFGFMMLFLPSGLTLYMLINSVTSILQQFYMNRHFAKAEAGSSGKPVVV